MRQQPHIKDKRQNSYSFFQNLFFSGIAAKMGSSSNSPPPPFHLAFPVHDIDQAREFYIGHVGRFCLSL